MREEGDGIVRRSKTVETRVARASRLLLACMRGSSFWWSISCISRHSALDCTPNTWVRVVPKSPTKITR
jgi:hypothetical protein